MSFLSFLGKVSHGMEVGAQVVAPIIPLLGPQANLIFNTIMAIESLIPKTGMGPQKKQIATAIITAAAPNVDTIKLSKAIDDIVSILNTLDNIEKK